jgi:hypothetical protein
MAATERANAELERRGVSMSMVFGARHQEHFPDGLPWTCTLRYARRRMTIAYYTPSGVEQEPTVAEVLASLFDDAREYERVDDFVEFCIAFGYPRDRRRSEWTYAARKDATMRLHHLLGDDYALMALLASDIGS